MRHLVTFIKNSSLAFLMLFGLLCSTSSAFAGPATIHISTPSGALPDGSAYPSLAYSYSFTATGDLSGQAWQIVPAVGEHLPMGLNFNSSTGTISGTPDISTAGQTFTIHVQVTNTNDINNGNAPDPGTLFTIHIARLPVDVMLVLDNSASMGCCYNQNPYDVTCETCASASDTRLKKLQAAVDKFITLGTAGATPYFHLSNANPDYNDRFGAVVFCGSLDNSHNTYVSTLTNLNALNTYIGGLSTCGGTCIGGAVEGAVSSMTSQTSPNRTRSLLLFTDGEQNYNPMMTTTAPLTFVSPDAGINPYDPSHPNPPYGSCASLPGTLPVFDQNFKNGTPGITISTIGFELPPGPGNTLLAALADPANGAGGTTNITGTGAAGIDDFTTFFTNSFVQLLNGSSPQLVGELKGNTVNGVNSWPFIVNDSVKKVSFIITCESAGTGRTFPFRVYKDSVDVTNYGTTTTRNGFALWNMDFPAYIVEGPSITAGGRWTIQSQVPQVIEYSATCVVDDHGLSYKCSTGGTSMFTVGSAIPLTVRLSNRGGRMRSAHPAKIVVLIQHNTGDGGTTLAQLPVSKEIIGQQTVVDPGYNNLGQLKHFSLLQTSAEYRQALGPNVDSVELTLQGDSIYTGSYTPKVTGAYKFTFLIHGKDSTIGEFYRSQTQSGVANLAHFDLSSSNIKIVELKDSTTGRLSGYTFTIIFKDSSGLLLGPAFNESILLSTNAGKFGRVVDNLDGSYTLTLTNIGSNTDPQIGIEVNGHTYYNGTVSGLGSGSGTTSPGIFHHWWFWLILLIILIAILLAAKKKK